MSYTLSTHPVTLGYATWLSGLLVCVISLSISCSGGDAAPDMSVATADIGRVDDLSVVDLGGDAGGDEDLTTALDVGADLTDQGGMLRDEALLAALRRDAESTMTSLGYNGARDAMYASGGVEDQGGRIECVYTGRTVDTDGSRTPGGNCALFDGSPTTCAFNTEHTVPRVVLRDRFGDGTPEYDEAEGDIHHLFPTEELANTARANFDFGATDCAVVGNCRFDEESHLGLPVGGSGPTNCPGGVDPGEDLCVMQVRAQRRGDVARAVFYMSMRYELDLSPGVETELRAWHAGDPPDDYERSRNELAEAVQGNRNPFVDTPGYVDQIADF